MPKRKFRNQESHPSGLQKLPWPILDNWQESIYVDEVGMGAWCGPLGMAAVVLKQGFHVNGIHDSKLLREHEREAIFEQLVKKDKIDFEIVMMPASELDELRLGAAWRECVRRAVEPLFARFQTCKFLVVDGIVPVQVGTLQTIAVPKADQKLIGVAAASILAKVVRDRLMTHLSTQVDPRFQLIFAKGKGYRQSKEHEDLLRQGIYTEYHRITYAPLKNWLMEQPKSTTPSLSTSLLTC